MVNSTYNKSGHCFRVDGQSILQPTGFEKAARHFRLLQLLILYLVPSSPVR